MNAEGSVRQNCSPLPTSDEIYRLIDNASEEEEYLTRIAAIAALGESRDPRAVIPLTICCNDKNVKIRRYAVDALSTLQSVRSIPALMKLAQDKNEDMGIRQKAMIALADIRSYDALEGLGELSRDDTEDPAIRALAVQVLAQKK